MSGQVSMVPLAAISHPAIGNHNGDPSGRVAPPQQLLAELSHDLRTPLASIRLMVQALRDGLVDDSGHAEYLHRIEQQISLFSALVDEVHSVARVQAGDRDWPADYVGPQELIEAAFATMRIQAEEKAVALECEVSPHLPRDPREPHSTSPRSTQPDRERGSARSRRRHRGRSRRASARRRRD